MSLGDDDLLGWMDATEHDIFKQAEAMERDIYQKQRNTEIKAHKMTAINNQKVTVDKLSKLSNCVSSPILKTTLIEDDACIHASLFEPNLPKMKLDQRKQHKVKDRKKINRISLNGSSASLPTLQTLRTLSGPSNTSTNSFNHMSVINLRCTEGTRYGKLTARSKIKLTKTDHHSVSKFSNVWEEILIKKDERASTIFQLVEKKRLPPVALNSKQEIGLIKDVPVPEYGLYGNSLVWIQIPVPKAPLIAVEDEGPKDKFEVKIEQVDDEALDLANMQQEILTADEIKQKRENKSKYQEDTDYRHFFLKPPAVYSQVLPRSKKPATIIPSEDLPSIIKPKGKIGVCISMRLSGFEFENGGLRPGDQLGLKHTLIECLPFVQFLKVENVNGLEIRSTRKLDEEDMEVYFQKRLPNHGVKVCIIIWVNYKDAKKAAYTLVSVLQHHQFRESMANNCPSMSKKSHIHEFEDTSCFMTQVPECDETILEPMELNKYSILSPAGSAALFNITVRIENGLEITQEMIDSAKSDLERRTKEFQCTNMNFEKDQKQTEDSYKSAINRIGNWRKTLYGALLKTEYSEETTKPAVVKPAEIVLSKSPQATYRELTMNSRGGVLS